MGRDSGEVEQEEEDEAVFSAYFADDADESAFEQPSCMQLWRGVHAEL
jgi:hypothetical protein